MEDEIIATVARVGRPLRAIEIAAILSKERSELITRGEVNSVIYSRLRRKLVQNDFFQWSLRSSYKVETVDFTEEEDHGSHVVNLDSVVKLSYSNGETLQVGFTKGDDSLVNGVKYISYKKPFAMLLLGKKVGDVLTPVDRKITCEILEIN